MNKVMDWNPPNAWRFHKNKRKAHFVGQIFDGNERLIVYKEWIKFKQRWEYSIERAWLLKYEFSAFKETVKVYQ